MTNMKNTKNMQFATACAGMDMWRGWIASALKVDQCVSEAMQLSKTWSRYLLTREGKQAQARTSKLEYDQDQNPRYFLLVMRLETTTIWACNVWHWNFDYPINKKKAPGKVLKT